MTPLCPAIGCGSQGELQPLTSVTFLILLATGVVTSPNYPGEYPSNISRTETIQVEEGMQLMLQFTAFNTTCSFDFLTITDGDGTTFLEKTCGSTLPNNITSTSNVINLFFKTHDRGTANGWSVSWSVVTPGV